MGEIQEMQRLAGMTKEAEGREDLWVKSNDKKAERDGEMDEEKKHKRDNVEVGGKDVGVKCYLYLPSCERAQVDGSGPACRTQCNTEREFKPADYFIYYYKQPIIRTAKGQTA